jgi:putative addiction module component (TIGR02574 family)
MPPDTSSLFTLSAADKLQLVEDLWDDVSSRPDDVPVHPWQLEEIERRRENLAARPQSALSWEEMTARLRNLHRGG